MKNFKAGDSVKLIFTGEIGVVRHWQDAETLIVAIDKVEFPVFAEFLEKISPIAAQQSAPPSIALPKPAVVVQPQQALLAEQMRAISDTAAHNQQQTDRGLTVALQPFYHEDLTVAYFLIHLINDSGMPLQFSYDMYLDDDDETSLFSLTKPIAGRQSMILNSLDADQINEKPELLFRFTHLLQPLPASYIPQFERSIKPKARMLRHDPVEFSRIDGRAYLHTIEHYLPQTTPPPALDKANEQRHISPNESDVLKEKWLEKRMFGNETPPPAPQRLNINAHLREIDLHIETLMPSHQHLPKNEILRVQMRAFEKSLDEAIKRRERSMVVIHGLGKGKLREEVMRMLREYKEVAHFKNELHPKYGYGATEISFEY